MFFNTGINHVVIYVTFMGFVGPDVDSMSWDFHGF